MLDKLRNIFSFGSKSFLGIDIGTSSIRVVELVKKKRVVHLANYGEVKTSSLKKRPFRIFYENNVSLSNREIAQTISSILKEAKIEGRDVSFAIPDFAGFFVSFEIPAMDKDEISQAVQYEVRPYIPVPINEVALDWTIIEGQPFKTPLKILVVAIPNETISQYQEIAQMTELNLKTLESEVFALTRAVNHVAKITQDKDKKIGLIDLGARSTTCSILEKEALKSSHSFKVGGNELTEIVAKSFGLKYNEAEKIRNQNGLVSDGAEKKNMRRVLVPIVDSILEEIKQAFRSFYREEGREIDKIFLAGGISLMPGMKEYFAASLKKPIVVLNPFANIAHPKILGNKLKEIGPSYAVAVGLALKGLE